jgi:hypothetical protein
MVSPSPLSSPQGERKLGFIVWAIFKPTTMLRAESRNRSLEKKKALSEEKGPYKERS